MTHWLIALLVVLNAATLAWQWDAFARWNWGPNAAREPERVLNQIRPEALKVETPAAAAQRLAAETAQAESTTATTSTLDDSATTVPAAPSRAP